MPQWLTATVADMQYVDCLVLDRKEDPIHVWCAAVEKMPHLKGESHILWS